MRLKSFIKSDVSPLQGGEILLGRFSWGFTPGYNMTGFQSDDGLGLKARDVIAQAEGLGGSSPKPRQAL